ncbi:hypothetical protein [Parasitella parasitica]|uniref:Uncharacterized protein n=1 Tax=Parasitella parasitica TaxID=35722 RepID=A0A0B7NU70_9FUNG|nr:hypothetical protein [Parasitella parasitica]
MSLQTKPTERLPRWQFRKKKKVEKRRKKRQANAEATKSTMIPTIKEPDTSLLLAEKQKYEQEKRTWEQRETKFKLVELAKQKAREKEERAKALTQKRWQDTLMTLPMLAPSFSIDAEIKTSSKGPFMTFVQPASDATSSRLRKTTYRERFLQRKRNKL